MSKSVAFTPVSSGEHRTMTWPLTRLRVVIAERDPLSRQVLRDLLQAESDVAVVGDVGDGVEAIELATYYRPDILLTALGLEGPGGVEGLRRLRMGAPEVRVVFLSGSCSLETELAALRAGASGFLTKAMPLTLLPDALRGVGRGEAAISPEAAAYLVRQLRAMPRVGTGMRPVRGPLTNREWEVVDLLGSGVSSQGVAEEMHISSETVRSHLKHISRKFGTSDPAEILTAADRWFAFSEVQT